MLFKMGGQWHGLHPWAIDYAVALYWFILCLSSGKKTVEKGKNVISFSMSSYFSIENKRCRLQTLGLHRTNCRTVDGQAD